MVKFLREQGPSINNRIVAPESFQFRRAMSDPILNDSAACANLDIVGGHIYGGGLASYPLAEEKGKKIWMTEHYINNDDIRTCVSQFTREIIDCMKNNMNAFIWWYLRQPDCNLTMMAAWNECALLAGKMSESRRPFCSGRADRVVSGGCLSSTASARLGGRWRLESNA